MPMPLSTTQAPSGHLDAATNSSGQASQAHLDHLQQPISSSSRTSAQPHRPLPHPHGHVATAPPSTASAGAASHLPPHHPPHHSPHHLDSHLADSSRAGSRPHLHTQPHHPAVLDLHGNVVHQPHAPVSMAAAAYTAPAGTAMPVEWGLYGVTHPAVPLNPAHFDFEVPGAMIPSMSHHGHLSPTVSDATHGYGGALVSPSSIHSSQSHYTFGSSWEDHLGQDSSTPTVTTPAAQVSTNPWTDPDELQQELDEVHDPRPRKAARSRKQKKDSRKSVDSRKVPSPEINSPSSASQNSRASVGSKTTSMASSSVASSSTSSSRLSKLRSASRTSKNSFTKPSDTPEDRRTRASHNLVEKQYRNRLNAQFESLLNALPEQIRTSGDGDESDGGAPVDWGDRRVSKGEVLEMARKHIESLEQERDTLEREKNELQGSLRQLKGSVSDGTLSPKDNNTPLDFNISMDDEQDGGPE
ncbi:hypothetical protein AK830_g8943 [Neonectria ditissima]|uniref:BHLH domain-containing protein n=1 Tax=Neonectria ditissima TaxID=78410 RepID=A0A0N8H604_9HYPO|nr:hypothetical protein AK830_g8943 [Neonectria ditissima]